ncbi:MAG: tRNA epoxyqueuosine(34) reductase QueG [Pirellulales bacterium]
MTDEALTRELKEAAEHEGFVLSGVAAAAHPARYAAFQRWLDAGFAASMDYLEDRRAAYAHPSAVMEGCSTLLMLAYPYRTEEPPEPLHTTGRVARYAWGSPDYHDALHEKLKRLKAWVLSRRPGARVRGVVDTAPLLEREFAEAAGLGWVGKNTLLLNRRWGSYFFLAALLTDVPLVIDQPLDKGYCGTCRACLDACPTDAFPEPYVLDARKCISYWTIEHRGPIDHEVQQRFGDWIFGCDVCQDVCPWNRRAPSAGHAIPQPFVELRSADLLHLLSLDDGTFRQHFRRTPLWRTKRIGLLRNAALLVGRRRIQEAKPALETLLNEPDPGVAEAVRWALSQLGTTAGVE